jgi:RNA polymerase sigma factor (sigma-70 family)
VSENFSQRAKDDLALVRRAVDNNDQQAITSLHHRYKDSVYFLVLKMVHNRDDAEDVTAESFSKAFTNLHKYSSDFAFSTWLYKIASNNSIDFLRKKRLNAVSLDAQTENEDGDHIGMSIKDSTPDPEHGYIKEQRAKMIREVMQSLKANYRELLELRYFQEKSYEEIEQHTGLPLGTVKAQLFRAKEALYNELKKRGAQANY